MRLGAIPALYSVHNRGKVIGTQPLSSQINHEPLYAKFKKIAEMLKEAGYATGGVGKWAMGGVGTTGHPNRNGFDFWMGYLDQGNAHNYYPAHLWLNEDKFPMKGNVLSDDKRARGRVAVERVTYSHDVMTDQILDFIRRNP